MTTRRAKYATAIRASPDRSAPIIARTTPNREYEILGGRLIRGEWWTEIREGYVPEESRGVKAWRER